VQFLFDKKGLYFTTSEERHKRETAVKNKRVLPKMVVAFLATMSIVLLPLLFFPQIAEAKAAANLDQVRNGPWDVPWDPANWVNGNAGPSNAHYIEGHSIPYRAVMTDLPIGSSITLTIGYDIKRGGRHAIDYLTHYERIDLHHNDMWGHDPEDIDPTIGVTGLSEPAHTYPIPAPDSTNSPVDGMPTDSFNALPAGERVMSIWNGTITGISYGTEGDLTASSSETQIKVTFTASASTVVLAWGGHISSRADWGFFPDGTPRSAGGIQGSSYHMSLIDLDIGSSTGRQDRSLQATAVYAPKGSITLDKVTDPPDDPTSSFNFTTTNLTPADPSLTDTDIPVVWSDLAVGTYSIVETVPGGWDLTSVVCTGETSSTCTPIADGVQIDLAEGENIYCTFTNTRKPTPEGSIKIIKNAKPNDTQLFHYSASGADMFNFSLEDDGVGTGYYQEFTGSAVTIDKPNRKVTINLQAGENVECTFENTLTPTPTIPACPTELTLTPVSSSQIDLSWRDKSDNELEFRIYRRDPGKTTYDLLDTVPSDFEESDIETYSDTGLDPNSTYEYRVTAYNIAGESLDCDENEGSASTFPPKKPGGACFIATAAYGSYLDSHVETLRDFRDRYLVTNPVGSALVSTYYKVSPPVAQFIDDHPALKPIVRVGLLPAVATSTVAVNTTPAQKVAIVASLALVSVALAVWLRRRQGKGAIS